MTMRRRIDLHGHRGARGLFPENTLVGFAGALAVGVDALELDVAVTADQVVVVTHDPRLNPDITRTGDGTWLAQAGPMIHSLRAEDLRSYDVGRIRPGLSLCSALSGPEASRWRHDPDAGGCTAHRSAGEFQYRVEDIPFATRPCFGWRSDGGCGDRRRGLGGRLPRGSASNRSTGVDHVACTERDPTCDCPG